MKLMYVAQLLGLIAGFLYGSSNVLVRVGLRSSNPLLATYITLLVNVPFLWALYLLFGTAAKLSSLSLLLFALAGLFGPALGRILNYCGMSKLGIVVNEPIAHLHPIFSALFASILLKESLSPIIYLAVVLSTIGVIMLSPPREGRSSRNVKRRYVLLPLSSAMCYAMSMNLRRMGLLEAGDPILGAAMASSAALMFMFITATFKKISSNAKVKFGFAVLSRNSILFLAAGVCNSTGFLASFYATSLKEVTIVAPLVATSPLFVLLISRLFLKRLETITRNIIIGTLLVVAGTTILFTYS
jgi:drug/metabolite transporter (DMT)-like permease